VPSTVLSGEIELDGPGETSLAGSPDVPPLAPIAGVTVRDGTGDAVEGVFVVAAVALGAAPPDGVGVGVEVA
jgi:hypothetical protein